MSVTERLFIRRLKRRDEVAFNELVERYQHRIFAVVLRMLGNRQEAEDIAQEVFVTVFRKIDGFRGESKLSTWLYRITVNHCRNRLKYLGRRPASRSSSFDELGELECSQEAAGRSTSNPEQSASDRQLLARVARELNALELDHRTLIVLRDVQGLAYGEIAEVTGLAIGTVKSRLHRARLQLKAAMKRVAS